MMIEVNLLPGELRRVEHTPLPRFLVVIFGTAAIMATGAFGVVVNWRTVPDLKAREMSLSEDVARRTVQAAVYDRLLSQIDETKDRKKAIGEIWRARVMWSEKLAQLSEMTPKFIGFQDINLTETRQTGRSKGKESGGMLTIGSICAGADHRRVANWRRIVKGEYRVDSGTDPWMGRRFFSDFLELLPTSTQKVELKDYVEREALKFGLNLPLKPASVRQAEGVAAARQSRNRRLNHPTVPATPKRETPTDAKDEKPEAPPAAKTPVSEAPAVQDTPTAAAPEPDGAGEDVVEAGEPAPQAEGPATMDAGKDLPAETDEAMGDAVETTEDVKEEKDEGVPAEKKPAPEATKPEEDTSRETENEGA